MLNYLRLLCATVLLAAPGVQAFAAEKIIVAQSNDVLIWTPMYVARGMNYFKDENLDVEVTLVKSGPDALTAVMTGTAQVTLGFPATPISAIEKGHDIKVFGVLATQFMAQLMIDGDVAKKVGMSDATPIAERIAKLKGLSIATNGAGSAYDYLLRSMLTASGLKPEEDVVISPVGGSPAVYAALERKRVDGIITTAPTDTMAERNLGAFRMIDFAAGDYPATDGLIYIGLNASNAWLKEHPDKAVGLSKALNRALRLLKDDPDAAKAAVRPFFKEMEQQAFDDTWKSHLPSFSENTIVNPDGLEKVLTLMTTMNGAPPKVKLDDIYTNEFAKAAAGE